MTSINRYRSDQGVTTPLDPIEDVTSWILGLKSIGYTTDVLKDVHSFSGTAEIKTSAGLIALFSEKAVGLLEQAYSGPPELSYLPLYYMILNLSKVYVILNKQRERLDLNRWHGASYNPNRKASRDLLTEKFIIKERGVFQLFYEAVTGDKWKSTQLSVQMSDIYPFILGISHEFGHAYKRPNGMQPIILELKNPSPDRFRLEVKLGDVRDNNAYNPRYLRLFTGFRPVEGAANLFVSHFVNASDMAEALDRLSPNVRRCLLYHQAGAFGNLYSTTPVSSKRLLLPPEIPIWLAFYHLSNVVRYNPEFLSKLIDSKSWPMLLALRRHAVLGFMIQFWSFLHQANYHFFIE